MTLATRPTRAPANRRRVFPRHEARALFEPGRATLEERIVRTWQRLVAEGTADCPVCGGELHAGRPCAACGSQLE